jgi:hypothetical protein
MRYEVEEGTNAVRIWYDGEDVPSIFQPDWPDVTPWSSAEEAAQWAELYIASVVDEAAPYAPNSPGEPGQPKPTPEEIAARQAEMEARQNGELPA